MAPKRSILTTTLSPWVGWLLFLLVGGGFLALTIYWISISENISDTLILWPAWAIVTIYLLRQCVRVLRTPNARSILGGISKQHGILTRRLSPWIGWLLFVLVGGGFLVLTVYWISTSDNVSDELIIWPAWGLVGIFALAQCARGIRNRRAAVILGHIEQAVRLNLPLSPMVLASAESESGKIRWRLMELHDRLESGEALAAALSHSVQEIPSATIRAIGAADQIGRLPQTLYRLMGRNAASESAPRNLNSAYRLYAVIVLFFFATGVGTLMAVSVMPKFQDILHSFGRQLPWITVVFIAASRSYLPLILAAIGLFLLFLPPKSAVRDYLLWRIPIVGPTARDRGLAELCGFISDALDAGQPMETALLHAAQAQPNAVLRKRIRGWSAALAAGQPLPESARRAGMPGLMAGMLNTVRGSEDLMQVMSFLARHYEYRFSRMREFLRAAIVPGLVCLMGATVLFIALAIFQPMIVMISAQTYRFGGF